LIILGQIRPGTELALPLRIIRTSGGEKTVEKLAAIRMKARPEKRKELLQTVLALAGETRKEKGCLGWNFYQDVENENVFVLTQEWESQVDLDEHLRSEAFDVLLGGVNLLCDPPEIGISLFSSAGGTESSEEAMGRLTLS
jgi:quinol monooxygenase YgiN